MAASASRVARLEWQTATLAAIEARRGRIDANLLQTALAALPGMTGKVYVCGANRFVEHVTALLLDLRVPAGSIRTERYGG
jgi:ferredoxin-NADP reductase